MQNNNRVYGDGLIENLVFTKISKTILRSK